MTELNYEVETTGSDRASVPGRESVAGSKSNLGPAVSADVEAILNDMEQARALAADYQKALAGKSNEFAELKQTLERTQQELANYQARARGGEGAAGAASSSTTPGSG